MGFEVESPLSIIKSVATFISILMMTEEPFLLLSHHQVSLVEGKKHGVSRTQTPA